MKFHAQPSFFLFNILYTDINECDLNIHLCDSHAQCGDTDGNYSCTCDIGFTGDGRTCCMFSTCNLRSYPTCSIVVLFLTATFQFQLLIFMIIYRGLSVLHARDHLLVSLIIVYRSEKYPPAVNIIIIIIMLHLCL